MFNIACKRFHRLLLVLAMACMCISAIPAHADSQALMDRMFETYINVTPGQVLDTQRRGGITFGSVVARSRVVRPNFISVQPPSFRGGCQGFDLIGGSFSFLNGEQLQQFLRAVASNALNYAFILALDGVCPGCMQKMEKLRDWSEQINSKLMDSCHWAKTLVNSTNLDDWNESQAKRAQNGETLAGVVDDAFDALEGFISPLVSDNNAGRPTPQNVVMAALQRSNMQSWFGVFGDQEFLEFAMSVTGTVVKRPLDSAGAGCVNDQNDPDYCIQLLPDLIDVEQLINGTDSGPVQVYRCLDWPECLNVSPPQNVTNWPGLKSRIRRILFGTAGDGLVQKYLSGAGTYTDVENRFIEGAPFPVLSVLERTAKQGGSAITAADRLADIIAVQAARDLMMEIVVNVQKAFGLGAVQMSEVMQKRIAGKLTSFATKVSYEDRQAQDMLQMINLTREIEKDNRAKEQPKNVGSPSTPVAKR